jgi:hypothetical protein
MLRASGRARQGDSSLAATPFFSFFFFFYFFFAAQTLVHI